MAASAALLTVPLWSIARNSGSRRLYRHYQMLAIALPLRSLWTVSLVVC